MKNKNTNVRSGTKGGSFQRGAASLTPPARTPERRIPVGDLCETDSRRTEKTEYVMRLLVSGRAPLKETAAAAETPPEPQRSAAPGAMTLENLTFDDLLAELEKL